VSYLSQLYQLLDERFNREELYELAFELNIDSEKVPGREKLCYETIRSAIGHFPPNLTLRPPNPAVLNPPNLICKAVNKIAIMDDC
jgi:hypothetical protein